MKACLTNDHLCLHLSVSKMKILFTKFCSKLKALKVVVMITKLVSESINKNIVHMHVNFQDQQHLLNISGRMAGLRHTCV